MYVCGVRGGRWWTGRFRGMSLLLVSIDGYAVSFVGFFLYRCGLFFRSLLRGARTYLAKRRKSN